MRRGIGLGVAALAAALLALAAPPIASAQGQVFTVTTTKDGDDHECARNCTLREAISLADATNGNAVSLPPGVYKLTRGELVVRNNVTVFGTGTFNGQGAAARTTVIDAQGASRVINVPGNQLAFIAGVTLTGGRATNGGGAVVGNNGGLYLYNASVDGNTATGRGGGVDIASGSLVVLNSTISRNHAGANGGGIAIDTQGSMTAQASTIMGNSASGSGGGISAVGHFSLLNVTVADNTATSGGGVFIESGSAGGDDLSNTILAGAGSGGACGGALVLEGRFGWTGNLDDDGTCAFTLSQGKSNVDPKLAGLGNNGGPTDTMAIQAGSPAIDAGDTQRCFQGDQRGAAFVNECDIGAFEFGGKPPQADVPPPVAGKTVNVFTKRGTVRVKLPGSNTFFDLNDVQQIPVGSTIDTTKGRVTFQAAGKSHAWFYQGLFKFGQTKGKKPLSTLSLTAKLSCKGAGKANIARKKKKRRRLWGDGKGRFRTKGTFSSATVRGTKWMVEDRCDGTLTVVKRGKVAVKDFVRHRTVIVKAGHKYFARRKK